MEVENLHFLSKEDQFPPLSFQMQIPEVTTQNLIQLPQNTTTVQLAEEIDVFLQPQLVDLQKIFISHRINILVITSKKFWQVYNVQGQNSVTSVVISSPWPNISFVDQPFDAQKTENIILLCPVHQDVITKINQSNLIKNVFAVSTAYNSTITSKSPIRLKKGGQVQMLEPQWQFVQHENSVAIKGPMPSTENEIQVWRKCAEIVKIPTFMLNDQTYPTAQLPAFPKPEQPQPAPRTPQSIRQIQKEDSVNVLPAIHIVQQAKTTGQVVQLDVVQNLTQQVALLTTQFNEAKAQLDARTAQLEAVNQDFITVRAENRDTLAQIESEDHTSIVAQLQEEVQRLSQENIHHVSEQDLSDKKITELKMKLTAETDEKTQLQRQVGSLTADCMYLQQWGQQMQFNYHALFQTHQQLQQQKNSEQQLNTSATDTFMQQQNTANLKAQVERLEAEKKDMHTEHLEEVNKLKSKLLKMYQEQPDRAEYECSKCDMVFKTTAQLDIHTETHKSENRHDFM